MIYDYLDSLSAALSFDRSLSQRVRQEIEDHLREAVTADPAGDREEVEQRAVARCGDFRVLAAEFAVIVLAKRSRRLSTGVVLAIAASLGMMRARGVWYTSMQWVISDHMRPIVAVVGPIDVYAFWTSVVIAAVSWAYMGRRISAGLHTDYLICQRRFCFLCVAATGALVVSVISDGVLTTVRLLTTEASAAFFVPILLVAVEIACAAALIVGIRDLLERTRYTASLCKS